MYDTVKMLHSYWAYLVLIILIIAVINAIIGLTGKKEYDAKAFRISLFGLIVSHIQLLIGIILYFVSPWFSNWSELGGGVMSDSSSSLYLVEHPFINCLAVVLITIGYSMDLNKSASAC